MSNETVADSDSPQRLWKLTYRDKFQAREVVIRARDTQFAQRVADSWLAKQPHGPIKLVSLVRFEVADESEIPANTPIPS